METEDTLRLMRETTNSAHIAVFLDPVIKQINPLHTFPPCLTFRHRASCILGQEFHYSPENAFYIFNQQIYFIIRYLLDRASLI